MAYRKEWGKKGVQASSFRTAGIDDRSDYDFFIIQNKGILQCGVRGVVLESSGSVTESWT